MKKDLTLEKEERIDGITVYKVFFGVECLKREEEIGANKQIDVDGVTIACGNAWRFYEDCLKRMEEGYPRMKLLASKTFDTETK